MSEESIPPWIRARARGAGRNPTGRFEAHARVSVDDGWALEEEPQFLRTEVAFEYPRAIVTRNGSPDLPFDRSINPYRGCEHGCAYCFARPSHAYLGLSPGLDFETRLIAKPEAPQLLEATLRRRGYQPKTLAIGTNTDPYQPIEARHRIMRGCLEVLRDFHHPVSIVTRGTLIERDIDILAPMAAEGLVHVGVSLTTLDAGLSRKMEPRAPAPARRLAMIAALSRAGIPVRAMIAPVVPVLTEPELEALMQAARDAGACSASWILLRLPREVAPLFRDWLQAHVPGQARHVMNRLREMRGGADYDAEWGKRMRGEGVYAKLLSARFKAALRRLKLSETLPALRSDLFEVPLHKGDQLALF